ncbi:hypothetical protein L6452_35784 [Arctium lappa]|uniref:Uncharacterized protein n=1 Tax=Arctium lappa TaxID=4217 RepID=A0ACB8Y7E9_ARCLA|nr:hypothetical protein L6452_35784 [Arctium lappa]
MNDLRKQSPDWKKTLKLNNLLQDSAVSLLSFQFVPIAICTFRFLLLNNNLLFSCFFRLHIWLIKIDLNGCYFVLKDINRLHIR